MIHDKKLFTYAALLLLLPLALAFCGGDKFRYPCQDPKNWDSEECKPPICDVTRTCPEHIFKGQRDPRLGPPAQEPNNTPAPQASIPAATIPSKPQGAGCGK